MEIDGAIRDLRAGEIVAIPTETVYGLAASATRADAVAKVFAAKARPAFDPLIVHLADAASAWDLVGPEVAAVERRLADAFWPGPLTLVLPRPASIPPLVTSGLDTVGVRVPDHAIARAVIAGAGPLAAPSANRFGRVSPTRAEHVALARADGSAVPVVDGGPCRTGVESTVVRVVDGAVVVLRPGGVSMETLSEAAGVPVKRVAAGAAIASPGMVKSHYAPAVPVRFVEPGAAVPAAEEGWVLLSVGPIEPGDAAAGYGARFVLSASGDPAEAAAALFATLRRLGTSGVAGIVAVGGPESGLGVAINDRLRRASASA